MAEERPPRLILDKKRNAMILLSDEDVCEVVEQVERLLRLAPLCEEHGTGTGARSGCPYCGLAEMQAALSKIDYAIGEPNEMEVSQYDVDFDEDGVVARVKAFVEKSRKP